MMTFLIISVLLASSPELKKLYYEAPVVEVYQITK